ncbi:hypothetical protein T06_3507 [Trichinella sp. T6]|nr:hypothetical protein T06_3507 [Trichinella sp. T6]
MSCFEKKRNVKTDRRTYITLQIHLIEANFKNGSMQIMLN